MIVDRRSSCMDIQASVSRGVLARYLVPEVESS